MQKRHLLMLSCLVCSILLFNSCSKDDSDHRAPNTKTELQSIASGIFEKAAAAIVGDITGNLEAFNKDNTITFTATANAKGTGVADEGPTKCDAADPQSATFNWTLENNETQLNSDKPLFPGGSGVFNIISLTETNLVVSQQMTIPPAPTTTVTITLKH